MTFVGVDRSNDNGNEIVTMIMTDTDDNNVMMAMKIMIGLIGVYPYIHLFIIKIIFRVMINPLFRIKVSYNVKFI